MNERDVIHEAGPFWVGRTSAPASFTVYEVRGVASYPDSSYPANDTGKSIAIARCEYLARRKAERKSNV